MLVLKKNNKKLMRLLKFLTNFLHFNPTSPLKNAKELFYNDLYKSRVVYGNYIFSVTNFFGLQGTCPNLKAS